MVTAAKDERVIDVLVVLLDVGLMLENSAVFQSQVAEQLVALRAAGLRAGLLAVYRDRAQFDRTVGERLARAGVHMTLVPDGGFASNIWRVSRALSAMRRSFRVGAAYVRGVWGALAIALAGARTQLPYVYDVRGALADETRAYGSLRAKASLYGWLESRAIRGAVRVSAVSGALAESVRERHGVAEVTVVPSCIALDRAALDARALTRRELGYADSDIVLVYSGGLSAYQQVPAMLAMWRRLAREPDVRFLLLTNDDPHRSPALVGDLRDFGASLRHASLPRNEVTRVLAAADIGFMLREARELNRAASPVKFAEYLGAGLAVVGSPGTGDVSRLIEEHGIGVLVDPADLEGGAHATHALVAGMRAEREAVRTRAVALAESRYCWPVYHPTFRALYGAGSAYPHDGAGTRGDSHEASG